MKTTLERSHRVFLTAAAMIAVCLSAACGRMEAQKKQPKETGIVRVEFESEVTGKTRRFALFVPNSYNKSEAAYPTILFLHGIGERGDNVDQVLVHGPLKEALFRDDFPFIVISPQCPKPAPGEGRMALMWPQCETDLDSIMEKVRSEYRVDASRTYLTGLSMGGGGSFWLAGAWPGVFAAVAPICGWGEPADANLYGKTPFWVFHGEKDAVVPHSRSVEMVTAIQAADGVAKLTSYPEAGHDSWTQTYSADAIYAWFLSHELEIEE